MLSIERGRIYRVGPHLFACGDFETDSWFHLTRLLDAPCPLVYSDPPWNAGNARYWRSHADGTSLAVNWPQFCERWCRCVAMIQPTIIYTEQSAIGHHASTMIQAAKAAGLPPLDQVYRVHYGAPVSTGERISVFRRENLLCRFATSDWTGDPSGLAGQAMTRHVFEHEPLIEHCRGQFVADPCVGKGMTARMAHEFGMRCVGLELNPRRLQVTIDWLTKQGMEAKRCRA
jgi:hypothetical protein